MSKSAAQHHEQGNHEKAAHHAQTARGRHVQAETCCEEASKAHAEEHGKE